MEILEMSKQVDPKEVLRSGPRALRGEPSPRDLAVAAIKLGYPFIVVGHTLYRVPSRFVMQSKGLTRPDGWWIERFTNWTLVPQ